MEHKLNFQFAQDEKLRRQYYRLRKIIYAMDLKLQLPELEDVYDPISEVLVVREGLKCIGGVKIIASLPNAKVTLPMENERFQLPALLPHLDLLHTGYAEFSQLVLMPDYRDEQVSEQIYRRINYRAKQLGVRYLFAITPKAQARRYIRSYRKLGLTIRMTDISIPTEANKKYAGLAQCVIFADLQERYSITPVMVSRDAIELIS